MDKKVLLLAPQFNKYGFGKDWIECESLFPPMGLLYLASPLIKAGYTVELLDLNVEKLEKKEFNKKVRENKFVLIPLYTTNIKIAEKVLSDTRKANKGAYILCGGPHCNMNKEYIKGSDITAIGEAENYIVEILNILNSGGDLNKIPGLFYKKNGKVFKTEGIMAVTNLDLSMPPALQLMEGKKYGYLNGIRIKIAPIMSSRGCPFKCKYCTFKGRPIFQVRSVNNVLDELKQVVKNGYKYIFFSDDNLLLNKKRVIEIMDRIIEEKLNIKMILQGRVDSADYEMYKKLREAGVIMIMYGIENVNQDVLDFYNKGITVEKINKAIDLADKVGIISFGYFMIGSPVEKEEHFNNTKRFFDKSSLDMLIIGSLAYIKGSDLWDDALRRGLIKKDEYCVTANKSLSNYSPNELNNICADLAKYFYTPKRFIKMFYKFVKLGVASLVLKGLIKNSFANMSSYVTKPYIKAKRYIIKKYN